MRNVQLMKNIYIYIPCVPHQNNCNKKIGSHDMKDRFLKNHCQECVRAYLSIHDSLSFLHEVMIGNHRTREAANTNCTVFGLTRPGIEPRSTGFEASTLTIQKGGSNKRVPVYCVRLLYLP